MGEGVKRVQGHRVPGLKGSSWREWGVRMRVKKVLGHRH